MIRPNLHIVARPGQPNNSIGGHRCLPARGGTDGVRVQRSGRGSANTGCSENANQNQMDQIQ
jgi:hypothetical protein